MLPASVVRSSCRPRVIAAIAAVWLTVFAGAGAASAQGAPPASPHDQAAPAFPATIPIFPLPTTVLFPGTSQPLFVFEPRYIEMVEDALKTDRLLALVLLRPGFEADYQGRPPVFPIGVAGRIVDAQRRPDGRYDLTVTGIIKVRILGEDQSKPYRVARVEPLPEVMSASDTQAFEYSVAGWWTSRRSHSAYPPGPRHSSSRAIRPRSSTCSPSTSTCIRTSGSSCSRLTGRWRAPAP